METNNKKSKEEMIQRWRKIIAKKKAKQQKNKFQTTDEMTVQINCEGYYE